MKRYLMVDGEKFPVIGMSFNLDGDISTMQIYDEFKLRSFVNIDSETEGAEKIDFATCYIEEETEAIEKLKNHLEEVESDLNELAHAAIPSPGEDLDLDDLLETWAMYHFLRAYRGGVEKAIEILESK